MIGRTMGYVVAIVGMLTVFFSVINFIVARSAMHETTASVLWCGGWIMIASGFALARLNQDLSVVPGKFRKDDSA